jgi:cell wall-associated NlpC family hydrolase
MQGYYLFMVKVLLILGCFSSFSFLAQTTEKQDTLMNATVSSQDSTLSATPVPKQVNEIVLYAKKFLGTPYHYSGTTPSGFDCSGFINYVMGNFGFELTRTSYGLAELGETVRLAEIQPGDLMFFKGRNASSNRVGHVAMVIEVTPDAIRFIHASSSRGVTIDNFKTSKYYIPRFIKAKRLDYGKRN